VFLDLSRLRPLDVLVSSGSRWSSKAIKVATTLRHLKAADYSHASMLLTPSLAVEALAGDGVVLTDLLVPISESHSAKADTTAQGRQHAFLRWVDGRLRVYVRLQDTSRAAVYRHVTFSGRHEDSSWLFRPDALAVLCEVYLREYADILHLGNTMASVGQPVKDALRWVIEWFTARQPEQGLFCSELVCKLMSNANLEAEQTRAETVAPSMFAWKTKWFDCIKEATTVSLESELPGLPCEPEFVDELTRVLRFEDLLVQRRQGRIHQASRRIANIVGGVTADTAQAAEVATMQTAGRQLWREEAIARLDRYLAQRADPVWTWLSSTNHCRDACGGSAQCESVRTCRNRPFSQVRRDMELLATAYRPGGS
jgi:hypothetical protein